MNENVTKAKRKQHQCNRETDIGNGIMDFTFFFGLGNNQNQNGGYNQGYNSGPMGGGNFGGNRRY